MPDIQAEIRARKQGSVAKQEQRLSKQETARVDRALRRQAVSLLLTQGHSQSEIARILYCSEGTVSGDVAYLRAHAEEETIPQGGFTIAAEPDHTKDDFYTDTTAQEAHNLAEKYALRNIVEQQFQRQKRKPRSEE